MVVIRDLTFRYPPFISGRTGSALSHVSLSLYPGELVLITGPSGCGKSTLARCLNGLIPHATNGTMDGDVIVCGMNTRDHDVAEFAPFVGLVFQDPAYQMVTGDVESEIAFALEIRNMTEPEIQKRTGKTADLLHIRHLLGRQIGDLSWGERQRVAIASVLAARPSILVMDEPFSGIDRSAAADLSNLLTDLKSNAGLAIVILEHRTAWLRMAADRRITMQDGAVILDETPERSGAPRDRSVLPATNGLVTGTATTPEGRGDGQEEPQDPSSRPAPSLVFRDVVYRYPGAQEPALSGITLDLFPGELTVITGPNGSGKSTFLKHCNGLLTPDRGAVFLGGEPLSKKTVAVAARTVGLLGQHADYQIFEETIRGEVAFGPRNLGMGDAAVDEVVKRTLALCSLDRFDPSTPPLGLSGGEKQRVALAGILSMETPVIVLDEPTFGLDPVLKQSLSVLLRTLSTEGKTVIIATHDEEFAAACGDRFIRIAGGGIREDNRPAGRLPGNTPITEGRE